MADLLPAEIRKIAEDVQKMEDEIFKKSSETPPKEEPPKEAPPKEEPPKEEPVKEEPPKEEPAGEEPPKEEPPKEEPPKEEPPEEDPLGKAEHKYKVLQGKYNKELPREREARKAAEERLVSAEYDNSVLRKQLSELTNRLEVLEKGKAPEGAAEPNKKISDVLADLEKDPEITFVRDEFPDVWKGLKKALSKTYDTFVEGTVSKITKVEEKVKSSEETAAKKAWMEFNKYLDDNVEGWRVVNKDPEFAKWLEAEDDYSGLQKSLLIKQAISEMDGKRVARFFIDFAKSSGKPAASPAKEPEVKEDKKVDVAPPRGRKPDPQKRPVNNKDEIITQEEITSFYENKRRGLYIGREAEMNAEEKRLEKAVVEGRVR